MGQRRRDRNGEDMEKAGREKGIKAGAASRELRQDRSRSMRKRAETEA